MKSLKETPGLSWALQSPWHQAFSFVILLTLIRVVVLWTTFLNLGPDEAQYWSWSTDLDFGYFSKPPMVAWVIALTTGIFGDSEAGIRMASPLLHACTAMILFALAKKLYNERTAFWTAVVYITMPAVAFSSALITTDVPLLFLWSIALLALVNLQETRETKYAIWLGLAIGLGLMSKYAMIYFPVCTAFYMALNKDSRWLLWSRQGALILLMVVLCILPNIYWNATMGFPTFTHTAANANWQGKMFNPDKMMDFLISQLGVFGPVLFPLIFIGLIQILRNRTRAPIRKEDVFLLCYSLPIILVATTQGFLSRANANWGVTAYVSASVFVTAWALRQNWKKLIYASTGLHLAIACFLYLLATVPGLIETTGRSNDFKRVREWDTMGEEILKAADAAPYTAIMGDDRLITAELLYYLRPRPAPVAQWENDGHITHHFELTIPLTREQGRAVLLVSKKEHPEAILEHFQRANFLQEVHVETGIGKSRTLYLFALHGWDGTHG